MGIQGLLPLLKSIMNPVHIKELEGCTVAVDTYSWLHKGALSCSTDLCKGKPTSKHIDYCMHRVNMLRHYGVKPILIFDGGPLPMKSDQEIKRARSRKENLSRAMEHELSGNMTAAYECYQKAVDISPLIAYDLIQVLKKENVTYFVAPYEADAQMAFLALNKHIDAVITEDSDLIAFGCPRIIYKMDKFGQGVEFKSSLIQNNKDLNLSGFTQMMILEMCILSGCDYLPSLPGMGLKKAHNLINKFKCHAKVLKHLKYSNIDVTPSYEESFKKAILTFRHQRVYDPVSEDIILLSELAEPVVDDLDFLGPSLPQHVAKGIARGDLDPISKRPIKETSDNAVGSMLHVDYEPKNFNPNGERKKLDLPAQKNLLTNYFCFASLEAKQKFKAPRITPNCPSESQGISNQPLQEVKYGAYNDNLGFPASPDFVQNPVCKPCISLHKVLDSDQENAKRLSGNKKVIVRSSYFMNKENINVLDENSDGGSVTAVRDHAYTPPSDSIEEDRRVVARSSCFKHKNIMPDKSKMTVDNRNARVRSSYFNDILVNDSTEEPESPALANASSEILEGTARKRIRVDSPTPTEDDDKGENRSIRGLSTSAHEEEMKSDEGKFGCNINHLHKYSNIAEKSMEKFVSVISTFRYNPSGSRASGLRAPLKDIKNNCLKRLTPDVDVNKFVYVPSKQKAPPRRLKTKA